MNRELLGPYHYKVTFWDEDNLRGTVLDGAGTQQDIVFSGSLSVPSGRGSGDGRRDQLRCRIFSDRHISGSGPTGFVEVDVEKSKPGKRLRKSQFIIFLAAGNWYGMDGLRIIHGNYTPRECAPQGFGYTGTVIDRE